MSFYVIAFDGETARAFWGGLLSARSRRPCFEKSLLQSWEHAFAEAICHVLQEGRVWTDLILVSWCEATQLQFILEILQKL